MSFFRGKKVFITGHTGFKGAWLCTILKSEGAIVTGYSLEPPTTPSLFELAGVENGMTSVIGDVRDLQSLKHAFDACQPEIVLHLAAQPIVRESYKNPVLTYETNVMGTVNILECVRLSSTVKVFLNVTTDKVYQNPENGVAFTEDMPLDGFDPYSNSKSCSELVTHSYKNSFFADGRVSILTSRAGNVIGGGDFAPDRIIPDAVRAALNGNSLAVRNPNSVRPYQHVLEPLFAYLALCQKGYKTPNFGGWFNVGPEREDCYTTGDLVGLFGKLWGGIDSKHSPDQGPHEANFLMLDCTKLKKELGWKSVWRVEKAVEKVVEWSKAYQNGESVLAIMQAQIAEYKKLFLENVTDYE